MACYCPLISDALTVTIMDMLQWIALTKYHLQAHQQDTGITPLVGMTDQHLGIIATPGITHHDHRDRHRFSHSQSHSHNPRHRSNSHAVTLTEVILDHFIEPSCT